MASAYVALLSLNSTIEQHQQRSLIFPEIFRIEFLKENTHFLLHFFEEHHDSRISPQELFDLEIRIKHIALEVDCMIDSHAMDQNQMLIKHGYHADYSSQLFPEKDILCIMKEFESIKERTMKIMMDAKVNEPQLSTSVTPSAAPALTRLENNTMVGFEKHMLEVLGRLTGHQSSLQILPIVGTGGIGKTTLVQNVYDNQLVREHFKICLWCTISQSYSMQDILSSFLLELNFADEKISPHESINHLGDKLYKTLFGRRYLIVMDDIWSPEFWDTIRRFFPKNDNGSRIIITTRLLSVAAHMGSCEPYKLEYLDKDESWNLLERKVFGRDGCPPFLEDVGRRIAVSCQGLPLAIVVIAGQLAKSDMTEESWENVARALISILHSENDSQCLKILSLSYDNLPIYLRPCFLYMAFSTKGFELRVSGVIKFWIADGILKPIRDKCVEDVAMKYLTDLVERNLISVSKQGSSGNIKCFRIHDLLHDVCVRKAHEHQFLYCGKVESDRTLVRGTNSSGEYMIPLSKFSKRVSSFDFSNWAAKSIREGGDYNLYDFRLRYIRLSSSQATDISTFSAGLTTISMFQNLQTLIIEETLGNEPVVLPLEIWEMPLLTHLLIKVFVLPDPPTAEALVIGNEHYVLKNMQTLWAVYCFRLTEEVVKRIPNLKKLKITYTKGSESNLEQENYCLHNLAQLCKLESLNFSVCGKISALDFSLPRSLRKLTLDGCRLPWEKIAMVGSLPNLEVLRLQKDAFCGRVWTPIEGEFCQLKALHLRNMSLERWEADSSHFPRLEKLILYNVWRLKEIPLSIGDISTLRFISAQFCRFSLESSVRELILEQRSMENNGIEVELPSVFVRGSDSTFNVMQFIRYCLYNWPLSDYHPCHETSVMIEKFEDNLCELNVFLNYANEKERNEERLKELVKHIRDVMYEAVHFTMALRADTGQSLSYTFRRVISVVKEVEHVSVRVQRLLLSDGYGFDEEGFDYYKNPPSLIDWNTDDEAYNFRFLHMISKHINKMYPGWLEKHREMAKYMEPVGNSSRVQLVFRNFALLTALDGISAENEINQDQNSTVHTGVACDYCEMFPLVGVRYRCKDCVDFDLCEECYTSGLVSDHTSPFNNEKHTSQHDFEIMASKIQPG